MNNKNAFYVTVFTPDLLPATLTTSFHKHTPLQSIVKVLVSCGNSVSEDWLKVVAVSTDANLVILVYPQIKENQT
jgi:hypothetical protein